MDTSSIDDKVVTLLEDMTEQSLTSQDITPTVLFLSALIAILSGVIVIDGVVAPEEVERLQIILNSFVPPETKVNQLMQKMIQGVEHHQLYLNPGALLMLVHTLSLSQRLMLMGLGYEMAAADGSVDARERMYLQAIAHRLQIPTHYRLVLETGFTRDGSQSIDALKEVANYLAPHLFQALDPVFVDIARSILIALPTDPIEMEVVEAIAV
jgi:uncharacterized tellurite resistance protein B-like protein